jgi:hypothetical protein
VIVAEKLREFQYWPVDDLLNRPKAFKKNLATEIRYNDRLHREKDLTEAFGLGFNVKAVKVIEESSDRDTALSASINTRSSLTASQRLNRPKDVTELLGIGF